MWAWLFSELSLLGTHLFLKAAHQVSWIGPKWSCILNSAKCMFSTAWMLYNTEGSAPDCVGKHILSWWSVLCCWSLSGMNGVVLPALERRYHLSSSQASLIPASYDIASAIGVIPISYYGDRAHKPRWLGSGSLVLGIGALVFAMPQVCCWGAILEGVSTC